MKEEKEVELSALTLAAWLEPKVREVSTLGRLERRSFGEGRVGRRRRSVRVEVGR
jgi:hypothetical protein